MLEPLQTSVCVCVCTFRRVDHLNLLLQRLTEQETQGRMAVSVVVVDNDPQHSARSLLTQWVANSRVPIRFFHEPVANISRARNLAVAQAQAKTQSTWLAFIDDDELPAANWLIELLACVERTGADGALGPVVPDYVCAPPRWLLKAGFSERPNPQADAKLTSLRLLRTGNVLIRSSIVEEQACAFDERLGRSGGEDIDFFRRQLQLGRRFVWCRTAAVREHVPRQRMTRAYWIQRALLRGVANAHLDTVLSPDTARSLAALIIYSSLLPVVALWPHHLFMQLLIKDCDHLGKVAARLGWHLAHSRPPPG